MQNRGLRDKMHHGTRSGPAVHSRRDRSRMGLPPESDGAALEGCMRTDTMVKWAMGIGALSVAGGAIALWRGAGFLGVVENVGNILILIALVAGKPIALRYPAYLQQIAFGVAVGSAGIGVWSIYHYSTEHVALSLMMVGVFWNMAADLLGGRREDHLVHKSLKEIYHYFKSSRIAPLSPLARVLAQGGTLLALAAIVCLFTITTW
jgi:hypothetical protein